MGDGVSGGVDVDGLGPRVVEGVTLDYWLVGDDGLMDGPTYRNVANVEGDNDVETGHRDCECCGKSTPRHKLDTDGWCCACVVVEATRAADPGPCLQRARPAPSAAMLRDLDRAFGPGALAAVIVDEHASRGDRGGPLYDWTDADTEGPEAKRAASGQPLRVECHPTFEMGLMAGALATTLRRLSALGANVGSAIVGYDGGAVLGSVILGMYTEATEAALLAEWPTGSAKAYPRQRMSALRITTPDGVSIQGTRYTGPEK